MSIVSLGRTKEKGNSRSKRAEPTAEPTPLPSTPLPPPYPAAPAVEQNVDAGVQFQLGSTMLQAVDRLTGMSADEIEVVADRLMDGARETEAVLRELARRVREYGLFANEKLANFVKAANKCTETARAMHRVLAEPDDDSAADPSSDENAQVANERSPADLSALEAEIEAIGMERAPLRSLPADPARVVSRDRGRSRAAVVAWSATVIAATAGVGWSLISREPDVTLVAPAGERAMPLAREAALIACLRPIVTGKRGV